MAEPGAAAGARGVGNPRRRRCRRAVVRHAAALAWPDRLDAGPARPRRVGRARERRRAPRQRPADSERTGNSGGHRGAAVRAGRTRHAERYRTDRPGVGHSSPRVDSGRHHALGGPGRLTAARALDDSPRAGRHRAERSRDRREDRVRIQARTRERRSRCAPRASPISKRFRRLA